MINWREPQVGDFWAWARATGWYNRFTAAQRKLVAKYFKEGREALSKDAWQKDQKRVLAVVAEFRLLWPVKPRGEQ